jgi:release factor glutamine methyltransferase
MTAVRDLLNAAAARLAAAGIDNGRLDARVLLAHVLKLSPGDVVTGSIALPEGAKERFQSAVERRIAREPLAYITGEKEFWSLPFAVGQGALIPRPETETVIEEARKAFPDAKTPLRILDLGTGTGVLLLTLLHLYPETSGVGVDASPDALRWARMNASRLGLESRARLIPGNWDQGIDGIFDLVVSNPPYVTSGAMGQLEPELAFEPREALDGGPDGLEAYRALAPVLAHRTAPGGHVLLEIGADQGVTVPSVIGAAGLQISHVAGDLAGLSRVVVAKKALETGR